MATIFTRIIDGEIPATFVWRDERCVAFLSINPMAHGHTLVVPIEEVDHWVDARPSWSPTCSRSPASSARPSSAAFAPERVGRDHRRLRGPARPHPRRPHQRHVAALLRQRRRARSTASTLESAAGALRQRSAPTATPDHVVDADRPRRDAKLSGMSLNVTHDPSELGFAADRLARIDDHFQRYVDAGRLPGLAAARSPRTAQLAHSSTVRPSRHRGRHPVDRRHVRAHLLDDQADHVGGGDDALRGGRVRAQGSRSPSSSRRSPSARVYRGGPRRKPVTDPVTEPMRMWHLLTHTSGLTYGLHRRHVTDELYRKAGFEWGAPDGLDLADCCDRWAALPLLFQPGTEWNYGVSTDVLGRVVEVAVGHAARPRSSTSGSSRPLKHGRHRLLRRATTCVDRAARLYGPHPETGQARRSARSSRHGPRRARRSCPVAAACGAPPPTTSASATCCSTAASSTACACSASRTVDYMTRNHLPGRRRPRVVRPPAVRRRPTYDGVGFGLGFSVVLDPVHNRVLSSAGEYAWGGAASTVVLVRPREDIAVVFLTQLLPSGTLPAPPAAQAARVPGTGRLNGLVEQRPWQRSCGSISVAPLLRTLFTSVDDLVHRQQRRRAPARAASRARRCSGWSGRATGATSPWAGSPASGRGSPTSCRWRSW